MKTVALLLAVAASLTSIPHASAAATRVGLKLVADGVVEPLSFNPLPGGGALVATRWA